MASDFTLTPTAVVPVTPVFNTIISQSESMKKQYQNLSGNAVFRYKLTFNALSETDFWTLYNHYHSCKGEYDSFSWTSVPSYIDTDQDGTPDGSNMTGHWVTNSLTFQPLAVGLWQAEIIFERSN